MRVKPSDSALRAKGSYEMGGKTYLERTIVANLQKIGAHKVHDL